MGLYLQTGRDGFCEKLVELGCGLGSWECPCKWVGDDLLGHWWIWDWELFGKWVGVNCVINGLIVTLCMRVLEVFLQINKLCSGGSYHSALKLFVSCLVKCLAIKS